MIAQNDKINSDLEFIEGRTVWIRMLQKPQCYWDEKSSCFVEYEPNQPLKIIRKAYIKKVKKNSIIVFSRTGGHLNGECNLGKYNKWTLSSDQSDYELHMSEESAIATVEWQKELDELMSKKPLQHII